MKKIKQILLGLFTVIVGVFLVACSSDDGGASGETNDDEPLKVAFLFTERGDRSTTDDVWNKGAVPAEEDLNIEARFIELPEDYSRYRSTAIEAAESDVDLIVTMAANGMIDEVYDIAPDYPDKHFVVLDAPQDMVVEHDNFVGLMFKQNEVSYLAGYLATKMTESDHIGVIIGVEYPVLSDFVTGFLSGAKIANEEVQATTSVIGDFYDAAKGKEIATVQYNRGADILFNVAGPSGFGILEAAKEQGKLAIGVDSDQAHFFNENDPAQAEVIVTSALKKWGETAYNYIEMFIEDSDSIDWGTVTPLGLKEGGVGLAKNDIYEKLVPNDIKLEIDEIENQIISGELEVQSFFTITTEEYETLKNEMGR